MDESNNEHALLDAGDKGTETPGNRDLTNRRGQSNAHTYQKAMLMSGKHKTDTEVATTNPTPGQKETHHKTGSRDPEGRAQITQGDSTNKYTNPREYRDRVPYLTKR
ncbi:Hypothetical predicted protein [Pelobates cultripes]|uniref:Uncharacterized protein n=1 Tax=Pelobates cultripes TaxID=61616 RepID=A0AAD1S9H3_PELCU|nr:Hypothetical predicted protein [Pelobates cultripes]